MQMPSIQSANPAMHLRAEAKPAGTAPPAAGKGEMGVEVMRRELSSRAEQGRFAQPSKAMLERLSHFSPQARAALEKRALGQASPNSRVARELQPQAPVPLPQPEKPSSSPSTSPIDQEIALLTDSSAPTSEKIDGPLEAANAAQSSQDAEQAEYLTVQGMLNAFGQSDAAYDMNGDGTVDVNDLLTLLSQKSEAKANTLNGILTNWGQPSTEYDLTGSGTVGVPDLLAFLGMLSNDEI